MHHELELRRGGGGVALLLQVRVGGRGRGPRRTPSPRSRRRGRGSHPAVGPGGQRGGGGLALPVEDGIIEGFGSLFTDRRCSLEVSTPSTSTRFTVSSTVAVCKASRVQREKIKETSDFSSGNV